MGLGATLWYGKINSIVSVLEPVPVSSKDDADLEQAVGAPKNSILFRIWAAEHVDIRPEDLARCLDPKGKANGVVNDAPHRTTVDGLPLGTDVHVPEHFFLHEARSGAGRACQSGTVDEKRGHFLV